MDAKLGRILNRGPSYGALSRSCYLEAFPHLADLISRIERQAKTHGYIDGLDGRKIFVDQARKALNYQLQSDEAIFVKVLMCYINQGIERRGIRAHQIIQMHDELQFEVAHGQEEELKELCEGSFLKASRLLKLDIPMRGTADVGKNWWDTH